MQVNHDATGEDPSEAAIRRAFLAGDLQAATRLTFSSYGREVLSFIVSRLRSEDHGQEAFAMFAEDLWRGLPSFAWRCTMRCWVYVLARNAANRHARLLARDPGRGEPLSLHASELAAPSASRPPTEPYRVTATKERMRALRELLSPEEQALLLLRVDRQLSFREIALIEHDGLVPLEDAALSREAARLRKSFERLKAELRRLAREQGLLRAR